MSDSAERSQSFRYRWFVSGDVNGFFGLMFDNLTVMSFVAGILVFGFGYPAEIVYTKMFPGTALGVLFGDLVYTWMAIRLARRTQNPDVCAMPLGLDTPSSIGVALAVLGPAFIGLKEKGMSPDEAALMTWYIGMATMVIIGVFKLIFSFAGNWVQKVVPQAGLLGSLAGIGLCLIGLIPMLDIFSLPVVGLVSLGLILYTLVAGIRLPGNFPGVAAAVLAGTVIYYVLGPLGLHGGQEFHWPAASLHFGLPVPSLLFLKGLAGAVKYVPIAFPFALLTVIGGINVTESARVGGDDYNTRDILLVEATATLVAGICGGVAQSTPYIGQPAYKAMGSRAGYTLLTGVFIGLGGILGYVSFIVELIPRAVLAPILIFVALDIVVQSFEAVPKRHTPAVALAHIPTVARLLAIYLGNPKFVAPEKFAELMVEKGPHLPEMLVIVALGNGFILTAMLWGGMLAVLADRKLRLAAVYLGVMALLTFFGITHSALPDGSMYMEPWKLPLPARNVPYLFSLAYLVLAGLLVALSFTRESKEPPHPEEGEEHSEFPGRSEEEA